MSNVPQLPSVQADEKGVLIPRSLGEMQQLAAVLHGSRMMPKQYDTPEKVVAGIQYAAQLGFGTRFLLAMRQIAVINGTPSMFGDLPMAMVQASGTLESIDEYLLDDKGVRISMENKNVLAPFAAAVCTVKRKGHEARTVIFTVQDAKTAGVWGRNVWAVYPKRMIQMRTRSMALKDTWADVLNGMAIGEYDQNTVLEEVTAGNFQPVADDKAARIAAKVSTAIPVVAEVQSAVPVENLASDPSGSSHTHGTLTETKVLKPEVGTTNAGTVVDAAPAGERSPKSGEAADASTVEPDSLDMFSSDGPTRIP